MGFAYYSINTILSNSLSGKISHFENSSNLVMFCTTLDNEMIHYFPQTGLSNY